MIAQPKDVSSGSSRRKLIRWWLAGTLLPAVMTTLIFLIDGLISDLLATGPVIVTQIVAWGGVGRRKHRFLQLQAGTL